MQSFRIVALLLLVASFAGASGCAYFIPVHAPHTPLLDHAGQVDVSARAGVAVNQGGSYSVNAAYAPIDHLEIVAEGDFDFDGDVRHYSGGFGVGTFVVDEVFRFEAIGGVNGGYARGFVGGSITCDPEDLSCTPMATIAYRLTGPYVQPYLQALVGFEVPYFELAGGIRFTGFFADVTTHSDPTQNGAYDRIYIEPLITIRWPIDIVRIELTTGLPIAIGGDYGPPPIFSFEPTANYYVVLGIGFQFDTIEQEESRI